MKQHPTLSLSPSKPLYFFLYVPTKKKRTKRRKERKNSLNTSPSTQKNKIKEYAKLPTLYTFTWLQFFLMCKAGGFTTSMVLSFD